MVVGAQEAHRQCGDAGGRGGVLKVVERHPGGVVVGIPAVERLDGDLAPPGFGEQGVDEGAVGLALEAHVGGAEAAHVAAQGAREQAEVVAGDRAVRTDQEEQVRRGVAQGVVQCAHRYDGGAGFALATAPHRLHDDGRVRNDTGEDG